eukprot:996346_1
MGNTGFKSIDAIAAHMAFHDDVIEVPEDTLKRIKHRFPKAKADDTNKIALKIYKDLIKYCSHDRGTLQNWKLEHALHMAKAHYDKNKPKQRIADLNSLYDQFLAPGAKNKVTLEDAGLFIALAASHKKNWEDNPNVNKGVWKTVQTKIVSSLSQPTTNFQISPAGAKWNAQVDYENELFDDVDYELEQIKRGHSYINYQPQTGSGIGGIGGTNGKIREIGYRTG